MKFNKVLALCKAIKGFYLYYDEDNDVQWLGDGNAIYPLYNHPIYTQDSLLNVASIKEGAKEKFGFITGNLPKGINSADVIDEEHQDEKYRINLSFDGKRSSYVIHASRGAMLLSRAYFAPLEDDIQYEIYERYDSNDNIYFAIKAGLEVVALIYPSSVFTTYSVSDELKTIADDIAAATSIENDRQNNQSFFERKNDDDED